MPTYNVKVQGKKGIFEYETEAPSVKDARFTAISKGKVLSIRKVSKFKLRPSLNASDRLIFLNRLAAMVASKMGTGEALALMRDTFGGQIRRVSGDMLKKLESGLSISEAMSAIGPPDFPRTTTAMVQAGENSGESWRALQEAVDFEVEMNNLKKQSGKGIWGALGGLVLATVLSLVSEFYVGPKIMDAPLMAAYADSVDTTVIDALSTFVKWSMSLIAIFGLMLFMLSTVLKWIFPIASDKIVLRIPYYKDIVLARNNFIAFYGLSLLIKGGMRIEESLRLAWEGASKGALKEDFRAGLEAVQNGQPWASAMKNTLHPTDKAALATSEDRERIAMTLSVLAKQYRDMYTQRLAATVPVLQMVTALYLSLAGVLLFGKAILPMLQVGSALL